MREIKFRVWDKNGKTMYRCITTEEEIDYYYLALSDIGWTLMFYNHEDDERMITNDAYGILMQYTGLKDKNDVEIFEGDMVKGWRNPTVVEWGTCGWSPFEYCGGGECDADRAEVIGNIYENKELLNEGD